LNWIGTQTELIDKALIENLGNIEVKEWRTSKTTGLISHFFSFPINNKQVYRYFKISSKSETLFLNQLKKSLFNYIT
jgi:hypothetical protein